MREDIPHIHGNDPSTSGGIGPQSDLSESDYSLLGENRRLIAQLARQASLLAAVLDNDPGAVAVYRGPELRLEMANPSYRALFPVFAKEDPIGKPIDEIFPERKDSLYRKMLGEVLSTGQPHHYQHAAIPFSKGYRYFHLHMMPLNDDLPPEERGVALIMWEMTEQVVARQKAEESAREAEGQRAWLKAIIDQMPESVVIISAPGGEILLANRAAIIMFGAMPDRITDVSARRRHKVSNPDGSEVPPDDTPAMRAILHQETTIGREMLIKNSRGNVIDTLVNAAPLYDTHGRLIAGVIVSQEITAMKEVERLKDEFMEIASHELRTPLTGMKAASQLLLKRTKLNNYPSHDVGLINTIVQQADRMARLVEELLDVSRLQTGKLEIHTTHCDLVALVREEIEQSRLLYPRFRFQLEAGEPVWTHIDPQRMSQVVGNLLSNAVQYSSPDAKAEISVRTISDSSKHMAQIQVQDEGIGFDPSVGDIIFERFSTLATVSRHARGMGLGLFICRQVMVAHGGTISAYSSGPGQGSTFTVSVPLA